jgi:anti-anti-sigma factor
MATAIFNPAASTSRKPELMDLVCGRDEAFLAWLAPVVRRQCVTLDLGAVQRIDAAGISALVSLYSIALQAGHRFTVANVTPRVAEVLKLVGLERVLICPHAGWKSDSSLRLARTAA